MASTRRPLHLYLCLCLCYLMCFRETESNLEGPSNENVVTARTFPPGMLHNSTNSTTNLTTNSTTNSWTPSTGTTSTTSKFDLNSFVTVDKNNMSKTIESITYAAQLSKVTGLPIVYPGTKWCGIGNVAETETDLGSKRLTDACCRRHDFCPVHLRGGESRAGVTNDGTFTMSHCQCDANFWKCLTDAGTDDALIIKYTFFTLLRTPCLVYQHPKVCEERQTLSWFTSLFTDSGTCARWRFDTSQAKQWSIVDQPNPRVSVLDLIG